MISLEKKKNLERFFFFFSFEMSFNFPRCLGTSYLGNLEWLLRYLLWVFFSPVTKKEKEAKCSVNQTHSLVISDEAVKDSDRKIFLPRKVDELYLGSKFSTIY